MSLLLNSSTEIDGWDKRPPKACPKPCDVTETHQGIVFMYKVNFLLWSVASGGKAKCIWHYRDLWGLKISSPANSMKA